MLALFTTGLDAVGKTSTLYRLKCGEIVTTIPTIGNDSRTAMAYLEVTNIIMYYVWCLLGCNEEMIVYSGTNFTIMDLSGREGYVSWSCYSFSSTTHVCYLLEVNLCNSTVFLR